MRETTNSLNEQLAKNRSILCVDDFKIRKKLSGEDMECIKSYRRRIKKLLGNINTYNSYRELSIAKTKLEEVEMWLSKLIKEKEK